MDRRHILKALSAMALAGAGQITSAAAQDTRQRQDIRTFSQDPQRVAELRLAFERLASRPPSQLVSIYNYAAIHDLPWDDPDIPNAEPFSSYWRQCHSDEALFFIWHRAYLFAFEATLQQLVGNPNFRLPYWNWYEEKALPEIFRSATLPSGERNWLHDPTRKLSANNGTFQFVPTASPALDKTDFATFQNILNGSEHGGVHTSMGGSANMRRTSTAARDPIFWLHHCNIDRLLAVWLNKGQGRVAPDQSSAWQSGRYKFPVENASADFTPSAAQLALNSLTPLGYSYESLAGPAPSADAARSRPNIVARAVGAPRALRGSVMSLNEATSVAVPATGATIEFRVPSNARAGLNSVLRQPNLEAAPETVTIVFDDVTLVEAPENLLGFDVFVNAPSAIAVEADQLQIGSIGVFTFTRQHPPGHEHGPLVLRFPAIPAFAQSRRVGSNLRVSLVPRTIGDVPTTAALQIDDARVEVSAGIER